MKIASIRMKIFLPVLLLLLLFPLAAWIIFGTVSENYMRSVAHKELSLLLNDTSALIDACYRQSDGQISQDSSQLSQNLLQELKAMLRKKDGSADMLIFNTGLKLTYPKQQEELVKIDGLYQYCLDILKNQKSFATFLEDKLVSIGQDNYLVDLIITEGDKNIKTKYIIAYVPVLDNASMLLTTGRLVFFITAFLAAASLGIVWFVSGRISGDLKLLCAHMDDLGQKEFLTLDSSFSIRELEELRSKINDMSGRLAKAEHSQTAFFQNVSHELRTPLMSISGYAQGIRHNIFPDPLKAAGTIEKESLRLKKLVDGILTLSNLENEVTALHLCSFCLSDFIEEALENLRGMEALEHVATVLNSPDEDINVTLDPELLGQAFQNLLSNCMKYAKEQVTVTLLSDGSSVFLMIEDDGAGFCSKDLPHIFERFYKGEKGSFGIGLSLAKSAVEYMGGTICACNSGHGARFTLCFQQTPSQ